MNRIVALLVLTLSFPIAARADEASHRAKAQEMMSMLHTEKAVQQVSDNILKQISDIAEKIAAASPSADTKAKVDDFKKQAFAVVNAQLGWTVFQSQLIDLYTKNFTEDEMDSIIAFYKSPGGSALLTKMPEVNTQISEFGQTRVKAMQPQLQQLFTDLQKKLAPPQPTLGPVPPSAPPAASPATPTQPSSTPGPASQPK